MITLVSTQKSLLPKACKNESNPNAKCGQEDLGFRATDGTDWVEVTKDVISGLCTAFNIYYIIDYFSS